MVRVKGGAATPSPPSTFFARASSSSSGGSGGALAIPGTSGGGSGTLLGVGGGTKKKKFSRDDDEFEKNEHNDELEGEFEFALSLEDKDKEEELKLSSLRKELVAAKSAAAALGALKKPPAFRLSEDEADSETSDASTKLFVNQSKLKDKLLARGPSQVFVLQKQAVRNSNLEEKEEEEGEVEEP